MTELEKLLSKIEASRAKTCGGNWVVEDDRDSRVIYAISAQWVIADSIYDPHNGTGTIQFICDAANEIQKLVDIIRIQSEALKVTLEQRAFYAKHGMGYPIEHINESLSKVESIAKGGEG